MQAWTVLEPEQQGVVFTCAAAPAEMFRTCWTYRFRKAWNSNTRCKRHLLMIAHQTCKGKGASWTQMQTGAKAPPQASFPPAGLISLA